MSCSVSNLPQRTDEPSALSFETPSVPASVAPQGRCVVSVSEGRGVAGEIGLATCYIDQNDSCNFALSQFADTQTFVRSIHRLIWLSPNEIILPKQTWTSKLPSVLRENIQNAAYITLERSKFNDADGVAELKRLGAEDEIDSLVAFVASKYFCLSAFGALIWYLERQKHLPLQPGAMKIRYEAMDGIMMIDAISCRNLELVGAAHEKRSKHTLLGVLNQTLTGMGERLLRMNLLQPLTDPLILRNRLDSVEELVGSSGALSRVREKLKGFPDLDNVLASLVRLRKSQRLKETESNINSVIILKESLIKASVISSELAFNSPLLKSVSELLKDASLDDLHEDIRKVISDDVSLQKSAIGLRNQRCFAVKAGLNGLLDVARQTYKETTNDVYERVKDYSRESGTEFKLHFRPAGGFHLSIDRASEYNLPGTMINRFRRNNRVFCTTLEIMKLNERLDESLNEVYLMSDATVLQLLQRIRTRLGALYRLSEGIAMLDMISSFAKVSADSNYVRPEFGDRLAVRNGLHPMLAKSKAAKIVPNDAYICRGSSFQIVSGPNMVCSLAVGAFADVNKSGKSTYLREVALLAVMAQVGSFVPADYACFPISKALFTRLGHCDDLESNASTFMTEMREVNFILQNIVDDSLVLIDELGRGTSTYDGVGVAFAVCEEIRRRKCFVLFATHFQELATAMEVYPNVVNLLLQVENDNDSLRFHYRVQNSQFQSFHYGITLARQLGFPEQLTRTAMEVAVKLKTKSLASTQTGEARRTRIVKAQLQLLERLTAIKSHSRLESGQLCKFLAEVQQQYKALFIHTQPESHSSSPALAKDREEAGGQSLTRNSFLDLSFE